MLGYPMGGFTYEANNWKTGTPGTSPGTLLGDPGATPHTKSATTSLLSALTHSCYWVEITLMGTSATGVATDALCDIMYDPAGGTSWSVLIPDLLAGYRFAASANPFPYGTYRFPLYIPRGATIGARWQTVVASPASGNRCRVLISVYGGAIKPNFWYGTKVTAVGADTATSQGLVVNPGSTGAYGGWVSVGGTTNPRFGYIIPSVQGSVSTHTADLYHVQFGHGSTQLLGAQIRFAYTTGEVICITDLPCIWCSIPAGTQLEARATGSDATSEDAGVAIYGVS